MPLVNQTMGVVTGLRPEVRIQVGPILHNMDVTGVQTFKSKHEFAMNGSHVLLSSEESKLGQGNSIVSSLQVKIL
jgi:hypothetical protein